MPGCYKDYTNFYPDKEEPGLSIFSNRQNNIMSCFIEGKPWRTDSRTTSFFSRISYEVYITKQETNSLSDTIIISWSGYYSENKDFNRDITLVLPVAKNFGQRELSALQGQRLSIGAGNGYFTTNIDLNMNNAKGSGSIYFHSARFDSISPGFYSGSMSGLFEADFNSFKILKGRFDHTMTADQIQF